MKGVTGTVDLDHETFQDVIPKTIFQNILFIIKIFVIIKIFIIIKILKSKSLLSASCWNFHEKVGTRFGH